MIYNIYRTLIPNGPKALIPKLFASQPNIHSYNTGSSSRDDYDVKHSRLHKQSLFQDMV